MKNVIRQRKFLAALKSSKNRKRLIAKAPKQSINAVNEIALNVLKGNVPLSKRQKERLAKYKRQIRMLADKRASLKTKRAVLQRGGAFLPLLLGPAMSLITSAISKLVN